MNRAVAWLRQLLRIVRPARGKHRAIPEPEAADMAWIGDLLPPTPPGPEPGAPPSPPRIARYVRLCCPVPGDTVFLPPGSAAMVLTMMGRCFAWDPRPGTSPAGHPR